MAFSNPKYVDARGGSFNNFRDLINISDTNNVDLNKLLAPVDAAYNRSGPVVRCLHGTREELVGDVVRWINEAGDHPICWLNGPAGSGKSAVSQTIAEWCDSTRRLAASFFFSRGSGDRSKIARLIPTLSYHLSISISATKPFIRKVVQSDGSIGQRSLSYQFRKLVIEPILAVGDDNLAPTQPMVIVIDALDECDDKQLMAEFIEIVTNGCQEGHQPFLFFFASRVEEHLRKKLEGPAAIHPLALQDFEASGDIRKFFESRFSTIYKENYRLMRRVPLPWPSSLDLDMLVQKASGSFIFAFTLINFVDDGSDLPHRKLPIALTAHAGLDPLYAQVLTAAPRSPNFKDVISTIMLLNSPLSIKSLGYLLQLEAADILQALLGIQSILMIPGDDDDDIQLFHASLREFLTTKSRSGQFFIDSLTYHMFILVIA